MASTTERLLCLSILGYRKPGMSEEDYHNYLSNVHGPLVKNLLVKYNIVQYTVVHNTAEARAKIAAITGPQFSNHADYDAVISIYMRTEEDFARMKKDPEYITKIAPDHENFADTQKSRMVIGWVEHHVHSGEAA